MATLITRAGKAAALSASEHDENMKRETRAQSGDYTVVADDNRATVEYTGTGGHTITLPDVSTLLAAEDTGDFQVTIKNNGTGKVTIAPAALNTVDGVDQDLTLLIDSSITLKAGSVTDDWMIVSSYVFNPKMTLPGNVVTVTSASTNTYYYPFGPESYASAISSTQSSTFVPVSGTLKNFYIRAGTNSLNGTLTATIRVNGVATSIVATIDGASTAMASDTTNIATVSAGDILEIVTVSGTATSGTIGYVNFYISIF